MMDDHTRPGGPGEEQALRGLLHGAVGGLEPSEGALERLRHAVPARRTARRRKAFVGAAAVALLGTAVPAALHASGGAGDTADHSAMAGHGEKSRAEADAGESQPHQNGSGDRPRATRSAGAVPEASGATGGTPTPTAGGNPAGGQSAGPSGTGSSPGANAGSGPMPPVAAPGVPGCGADQLGVVGSARAPEADGKVYGSFKVTNVSAQGCTVTGPDTVRAAPASGAAAAQGAGVAVVGHTAGDPASGLLPDPSAQARVLTLEPNTAYEVRFAWVPPAEPCPAQSSTGGGGKPPQGGSAGASDGAGDGAAAAEPQTGRTAVEPGGVEVTHTPQTGTPTTRATIPEACGGTVYRTGPIPVEESKP